MAEMPSDIEMGDDEADVPPPADFEDFLEGQVEDEEQEDDLVNDELTDESKTSPPKSLFPPVGL